ncbi:MAG: S41 family peptidase [Lachnospiraceae bacterium]|nr:S41 family peptidase [Lachnospiraceae bacterium]
MNENEKDDNRSFWRGLAVGLASSCAILLVVFGSVKIYQTYRVYGRLASGSSAETESVANEKTTEKLGVLENTIKQYFWQDVDESTLEEGVYKGLLESLDDPYSVYYTHDELVQLQQQTEGIYYGIGAYISQDNEMGYVRVSKIIKNTPAEASGLQQDDYIYKVDGEDMQGKDSSYVVSKIKGEAGTKVTITVVREGATDPIDIEVERQKIESPTVEYQMLDNDMAYIQITEFDLVTTEQFEEAYKQAQTDGMKGLILDLRSNPGGNLSTVCDIARMILPKGLIVYTEDKYGKREEYTCDGANQIKVPLVVLTNGYSASASEILAGAVKDYGIGTLVGTTTYGKGIVQKVINLSDGSAVKLTVSNYFTPNGNNIHKIGIDPDVEVEFDAEQYKNGVDNQLEKAKEVLAGLM